MSDSERPDERQARRRSSLPEEMAESISETEAEGRRRTAAIKRFLSEATSPDAFGLSAIGAEYPDGLEWLRVQFVQTHPDDRQEIMELVLYPVLRDGRVFIEAQRFDRQSDPSGRRVMKWEGDIRHQNRAEIERLRGDDHDEPW